jgi:hypothetical protein
MKVRHRDATTRPRTRAPLMSGIGWRHPHYAELLETQPALGFIEVHSENFFAPGGACAGRAARGPRPLPGQPAWRRPVIGVGQPASTSGISTSSRAWCTRSTPCASATTPALRAAPCPARTGPATVHAADLLPVPFSREALDVMCANVQRVQDRLRRPLAVENLSAYLRWQDADMSETQFLSTLAQRTGCSLLVDVNNIYVNALNAQLLGEPGAPLEACRRMAGPDPRRGGWPRSISPVTSTAATS